MSSKDLTTPNFAKSNGARVNSEISDREHAGSVKLVTTKECES